MHYTPTIGLEIHIELKTKSKMFCSCLNDANEKVPNVNICPICLGHPGTLPVINEEAVRKTIKTGLALNCTIPERSQFDRKNYFYPDLPKGYQISQLYFPFCKTGFLKINGRKIKIREVHLEEDTGKLIHEKDCSLVDFNRAGVPLMELATEPDITSAKEARAFAQELQLVLRYLGVSGANMEKGQMRVEANISLSKTAKLGTKVEIKNLNSFRSVEKGIEYEIERQAELLQAGKKVVQETRGWQDIKEITFSQREKEESHDYRYFSEPDLPPLSFAKKEVKAIQLELLELPQIRRERFKKEYGLGEKEIEIFIQQKDLGEYFEKVAGNLPSNLAKLASDFLINTEAKNYRISPAHFSQLMVLVKEGKISTSAAKTILPEIVDKSPSQIIKKKGVGQVNDQAEITKIIKEVISKNSKPLEDYKKGKKAALQFLIGQVMVQTKGKANPVIINKLLTKLLDKK